MSPNFSKREIEFLQRARVAILGTIDSDGRAHLVPIVFANHSGLIYFVIDSKEKKSPKNLKRLKNLARDSRATLLVHEYFEDWSKLTFLILYCKARILGIHENLEEKEMAARCLRGKYPQYLKDGYFPTNLDKAVFVSLMPEKFVWWQNLRSSLG